ncbi:MAG: hypothetical protein EPN93_10225 [Spirochaetes bacterium]|nr:MAG: hypothetical protein EPN93_10225 [Spirochaetota bacterium]
MTFDFFYDSDGDARAKMDGPHERAGDYLESDIQGSAAQAKRILAAVDDILAGRLERFQETGNANTLVLSVKDVRIIPESGDAPPLYMDIADFRELVAAWLRFLELSSPAE